MKKTLLSLTFALFFSTVIAQGITGSWYSTLVTPGGKLIIVFNISKKGEVYSTTMDSPDQHVKGVPIEKTTFVNKVLTVQSPGFGLSYTGTFKPDSDKITGTFTQGAGFPLTFTRKEIKVTVRPQDPVSFPYKREEVTIVNSKANVKLEGTLTMPIDKKASKIVVFITGSGPQNRNEELCNHRPFLVWADWFARQGIAVLRYDDRGVASSTGDFSTATSADFATDAESAVRYIKARPDLKNLQVGLMGHSEGGLIAPMIACSNKNIDFIVLLAGPGVPLKQLMIRQALDEEGMSAVIINEKIYSYLLQNPVLPMAGIEKGIDSIIYKTLGQVPAAALQGNSVKDISEEYKQQVANNWFRYFIALDPAVYLAKVQCPVLAINGTLDMQVSCDDNLNAIKTALQNGGNKHFETVPMPGLNHLMQKAITGATTEYVNIDETVNPAALKKVSAWINALK